MTTNDKFVGGVLESLGARTAPVGNTFRAQVTGMSKRSNETSPAFQEQVLNTRESV